MGNRKVYKTIASLRRTIGEHRAKIAEERMNSRPQVGVIQHWESEIRALSGRLQRLERRLMQRRRRGR